MRALNYESTMAGYLDHQGISKCGTSFWDIKLDIVLFNQNHSESKENKN